MLMIAFHKPPFYTFSQCDIKFNNTILIASGTNANRATAAKQAFDEAIKELSKSCYTLKLKCLYVAQEQSIDNATALEFEENKLGEKNIGFRLLKSMGWSGGGLGQGGETGIAEPIALSVPVSGRSGVGKPNGQKRMKQLKTILYKFAASKEAIDYVIEAVTKQECRELKK